MSTQPSIPPGSVNRVPAELRRGVFTCVGWQVTLCDPIWQVTPRSSEVWFSMKKTYPAFTLTLTLTFLVTLCSYFGFFAYLIWQSFYVFCVTWKTVMIAHRRLSKFLRPQCFVPISAGSQNLQPNKCIPRILYTKFTTNLIRIVCTPQSLFVSENGWNRCSLHLRKLNCKW